MHNTTHDLTIIILSYAKLVKSKPLPNSNKNLNHGNDITELLQGVSVNLVTCDIWNMYHLWHMYVSCLQFLFNLHRLKINICHFCINISKNNKIKVVQDIGVGYPPLLSTFTSGPVSLLATTKASVFYSMHTSSRYINIMNTNHKLICTV